MDKRSRELLARAGQTLDRSRQAFIQLNTIFATFKVDNTILIKKASLYICYLVNIKTNTFNYLFFL